MQSRASENLSRGNNTHVTDGEPIDIDQRSILDVELPTQSIENATQNDVATSTLQPNTLYSNQMGQGASTPRDESARNRERRSGGEGSDGEDRAAIVARLRRSRRIRNHMEHFANRLMPRTSAAAAASSGASATSNTSGGRTRVSGLRFRTRAGVRSRSRSLSPPRRTDSARRRTMPPISSPIPQPRFPDYGMDDMMDISPVSTSTVTPQSQSQRPPVTATVAGSRRSRLSRMRDSIGSFSGLMSSELGSMLNRPNARRPSESRTDALDSLNGSNRRTSTTDATMDTASTNAPSEAPSRPDRPSLFGPGQSLLDNLQNPGRIRPGEDQATMLSRLLSVAAAATAASLVGNAEEAITQAQDVGGDNGGDGSFESFLRALQNGRLEAALRNGGNEMGGGNASGAEGGDGVLSLNFFRMFRFGSTPANNNEGGEGEEGAPGSRMVPVIIVGIRSVSPRESAEGGEGARPAPFFDALANLPVNLPSGVHRRSRFGSNGLHRRTASAGSPVTPTRPTSSSSSTPEYVPFATPHSDTPTGPNPPPTTPATLPGSALPSRRQSAVEPGIADPSGDGDGIGSGRDSFRRRLPRPFSSPDSSANPFSLPQGSSSGENGATNNRGSSSTTAGPSRPAPAEGTRSWIIYVLGGSYPENHPILTTPSLFTDEPTYEDMTLLSSLLGPAKLPVAAKEDLESAGGLFTFGEGSATQYGPGNADRCLICLADYETGTECRKLIKCSHIFHKDCIDEWLTTGRNSCPLCRGEGVEEKSKATEQPAPPAAAAAAAAAH